MIARHIWGQNIDTNQELHNWAVKEKQRFDNLQEIKTREYDNTSPLYPYQRNGVEWLKESKTALLADDMGLGKTVQVITALKEINCWPVLIICPPTVVDVWVKELNKWTNNISKQIIRHKTPHKRIEQAERDKKIFVTSYNTLTGRYNPKNETFTGLSMYEKYGNNRLEEPKRLPRTLNRFWEAVILDEAHKIKDPSTNAAKACWGVSKNANRRWCLTGTPMANDIGELWSILRFLDPTVWTSMNRYREFFADYVLGRYRQPIIKGMRKDTQPVFEKIIDQYMLRRIPEEVNLQLPEVIRKTIQVDLLPAQASQYKKLLKENKLECLALTNGLTQSVRLHQSAQSELAIDCAEADELEIDLVDDAGVTMCGKSSKVDALLEFDDTYDKPYVVFSHSKQLAYKAAEGLNCPIICGDNPEERAELIEAFQDGKVENLVLTLATGSEGITLTRAQAAVFLQRSYKLTESLQAEKRIRRIGSTHDSVLIVDIVTRKTVDELPALALDHKNKMLQEVLRDPIQIVEWAVNQHNL